MIKAERDALVEALGEVVVDEVRRALAPLEKQIDQLRFKLENAELRVRELRYAGTWSDRGIYRKGNMVTHSGSMWHCNLDNIATVPGHDHDGWTLAVKSMARS